MTVTGTETITGVVTYSGDVNLGDAAADTVTIAGTSQVDAPLTVGADDTGHDVKLFGATASKFMVWDESADDLILADAVALQLGGDESTADGFKLEFDGTDTLAVDALTANDTLNVGSNTSTDVTFTTANGTVAVDASADTLTYTGVVPTFGSGFKSSAESLTPNTDEGAASSVSEGTTNVDVGAVTTDANDFIVLPSIANVPVGHTITIACNAGTNFEMRTPSTSGEKINNVDSDGTNEYLCTDTDTVVCRKVSDTDGWTCQSFQISGAVRTAVTPD